MSVATRIEYYCPFRGANALAKHYLPTSLNEVRANVKEAVEDPNIDTIVFESISMFGDNMLYPELVNGRPDGDSRAGYYNSRAA